VLLQGVLTERGDHLPDHLEALRARSRRFRQIVAESGIALSPAQVAITFALAHPQINAVLMGVRALPELTENLQAVEATLPADLLEQLYPLRLDDADLLNPATWRH
jgi:aryl-alcohol dehydrogenase-like predicted oxidoreductase